MFERDDDIYASAPLRSLRHEQKRALIPQLQRCSGTHALMLTVAGGDVPPTSPVLDCWATLHVDKEGYTGVVSAASNEPLPFIDDAFQLILIQHVLEIVSAPTMVLDDAVRMLAPGGLLVITGVHPVSVWSPWFWWRGRRIVRRLYFPMGLTGALRKAGLDVERMTRVGRSWPGRSSTARVPANVFGGGYVLVARKRRHTLTLLRLNRIAAPVSNRGRLSPETRRSAAL